MRAPLPKGNAFNQRAAAAARLSAALIYVKVILKITAAVNPVNTGTVALDAFKQYLPDGVQESDCLFRFN